MVVDDAQRLVVSNFRHVVIASVATPSGAWRRHWTTPRGRANLDTEPNGAEPLCAYVCVCMRAVRNCSVSIAG